MKPTLLVLAAGMGSRYGGLKQMDGLGPNGETIIDYSIYDAVNAGFGKVVYIVREYFREQFEQTVKDKYSGITCPDGTPLEFDFVIQELNKIPSRFTLNPERQKPWGTAHAVLMAKDVIHEPFAVINGDDYYGKESFKILGDWLRAHEGTTGTCSIVGFELDNTLSEYGKVSRGICYYDQDLHLTGIAEHLNIGKEADGKVYGDNSVNGETHVELDGKALCSMNMWGFTPDYFQLSEEVFTSFLEQNINELKKEYYIPYAVDILMKERGYKCEVLSTDSHWFGVTYKEDRPGVVASSRNSLTRAFILHLSGRSNVFSQTTQGREELRPFLRLRLVHSRRGRCFRCSGLVPGRDDTRQPDQHRTDDIPAGISAVLQHADRLSGAVPARADVRQAEEHAELDL